MNLLASVFAGIGMLFSGLFGGHQAPPANTASTTPWQNVMGTTSPEHGGHNGMGSTTPHVMGKVDSVSGTTLMITGRSGMNDATTTFTVDASAAKIMKFSLGGKRMASSTPVSVSDIQTGDSVMVTGTISGTSVTATTVIDGVPPRSSMGGRMQGNMQGMHMGGQGGASMTQSQ